MSRLLAGFTVLFVASSAGFAQDGVRAAEKELKQALVQQDKKGLSAAVRDLVVANTPEAAKVLLGIATKGPAVEDPWWMEAYWMLLNAAASFTEPAALKELGDFVLKNKSKPVARDAVAMVCNHGQKELLPLCLRLLDEAPEDLKIMAADHLVAIGDKTVVAGLLKALKANEKNGGDLRKKIGRALTVLTGQDYGDNLSNWEGWWETNREKEWDLKKEEGTATGTVTDTFDRGRSSEFDRLKRTGKVLVLGAGDKCKCGKNHDLDHIDHVTRKLGLTTEVVTKVDFEAKDIKLNEYVAILANCTHIREHCVCPLCKPGNYSGNRLYQCICPQNKHENAQYVLGEKGIEKIRRYVAGGGYLFAEDWCMEDFMEKAFPDHVAHGSVRPEEEVPVFPKAGAATHPYLKKIFFKAPKETRDTLTESDLETLNHVWKIDMETRTIKVKDPRKVVTLLTSPALEKYAQGDDAVAVTFAVGGREGERPAVSTGGEILQDRSKMSGGRVLYVLSHFGKQKSQDDEYALQNLLINFLVEANERRGTYAPPSPGRKGAR